MDEAIASLQGRLRLTDEEDQRNGGTAARGWSVSSLVHHIIDRNRTLEGCPWSSEKNIIILNEIREHENPLQVNLELCDFHVHVHELPLSMMNLGVATLLGNRICWFRDLDMDDSGCAWGRPSACVWPSMFPGPFSAPSRFALLLGMSFWCISPMNGFRTSATSVANWVILPRPQVFSASRTHGEFQIRVCSGLMVSKRGGCVRWISGLGQGTSAKTWRQTGTSRGGHPYIRCELQSREDDPAGSARDTRGLVQDIGVDSNSGSDGSMTAPVGLGPRAPLTLGAMHGQSDMGEPGYYYGQCGGWIGLSAASVHSSGLTRKAGVRQTW
ncbi:hypothetical protein Salat_1658900 [Sesamum alatum]|uniref:Uncharacterized protein n=1 Tax=Sesamum alatum TaxID=300844 RepID=A0AAE2CJN9_9LAMI|nr:hypothetical protein Salat_1658900 [Sesamum alatum]